ncbi:hypothetical protein AB0K12_32605 [Nonomuraea sp. NPDC049419]|uniref:hypothetical protein n=1 Tax=Nonomuraea sp. NPDC049419 TaxID=3155772 RepID=UPI00343D163E
MKDPTSVSVCIPNLDDPVLIGDDQMGAAVNLNGTHAGDIAGVNNVLAASIAF